MKSDKYPMVRTRRSDRTLIIITVLVLSVEIVWLLMHLRLIPNPFQAPENKSEQQRAGYILKSQQELRRRGLNSLVWENAGKNEILFFHDSILTLSQSSATLHLDEQTEIHLSENTLVTIEPPNEGSSGQIRLKFTQGDLRARNPFASTKIESKEWELNLDKGSEVSLRQTGPNDFEVDVLKGQLEFQKNSERQSLVANEVLKIEDNKILETLQIEESLRFQGPAYQRIYSFQRETPVSLSWEGDAQQLEISPSGKDKIIHGIEAFQKSKSLQLLPGKYALRLVKDGKISESKEIEIWEAPTLHLLSPFPRDRVKTKESVPFVWSDLPGVKDYKLVLTDLSTGKTAEQRTTGNVSQFEFADESDISWKVIGIDSDGFEIPAPYANQIFPRHEPLEAPKLQTPRLRAPTNESEKSVPDKEVIPKSNRENKSKRESKRSKEKTSEFRQNLPVIARILLLSLPFAEAAETKSAPTEKKADDYEAVFAWEPVSQADIYNIEISDTPDFRSPRISKTVKKTEFIWKRFPLGVYYWRVAAGTSQGRMGVFSAPAKASLDRLPENSGDQDGIWIRKKTAPPSPSNQAQEEKAEPDTATASLDEKKLEEPAKSLLVESPSLKNTYFFEWTPLFTNWDLRGSNQLKAVLSGSTLGAGHFRSEQVFSEDTSYFVDVFYAQYKWLTEDPVLSPDQSPQALVDARIQVLRGHRKSTNRRGVIVQTVPTVEKKSAQKVEIKSSLTAGLSADHSWLQLENWRGQSSLSLMAGSQVFALSSQNSLRYLAFRNKDFPLSVGMRFQMDLISAQGNFSQGWSAGLTFGFEN